MRCTGGGLWRLLGYDTKVQAEVERHEVSVESARGAERPHSKIGCRIVGFGCFREKRYCYKDSHLVGYRSLILAIPGGKEFKQRFHSSRVPLSGCA